MSAGDLSPSPLARALLELSERGADGLIEIGGRSVVVRRGSVVNVLGTPDDESFAEFLFSSGRIDAKALTYAKSSKSAHRDDVEALRLPPGEVVRARRALWLDRLVRALGAETSERVSLVPDGPGRVIEGSEPLPELVLDALERRAGEHDAGEVGERASEKVHWVEGPHAALGKAWCRLDPPPDRTPVYECLRRAPAAAARIAALLRAGLVTLRGAAVPSPPPAPPPEPVPEVPLRPSMPRFRDTLRPGLDPNAQRAPAVKLDATAATIETEDFAALTPELPALPDASAVLDDPLDALEREIAALERDHGAGDARARQWTQLAKLWLRHHGSIDEAARCHREAVAADATSFASERDAAMLCAAMGRLDLARAYARAAVRYAPDAGARARAWLEVARLEERGGDLDRARAALVESTIAAPTLAAAWQRLARHEARRGHVREAAAIWLRGAYAVLDDRPQLARAFAEHAYGGGGDPDALSIIARALVAEGKPLAAFAMLRQAAPASFPQTTVQRLRVEAAEIAEREGRIDLAFESIRDAFDVDPEVDALHEPVAAYAAAAGLPPLEEGVLLESMARHASREAQGEWLARAADAFELADPASTWPLELRSDALALKPDPDVVAKVLAHGDRTSDLLSVADALERAVRKAQADGIDSSHLLVALAEVSEQLSAAPRAYWAWSRLAARTSTDEIAARIAALDGRVRLADGLVALAERDLERATPELRLSAERKLATLLRDHPDARRRAVELHRALLAEDPSDENAELALERMLFVLGEDEERRLLLAARVAETTSRTDRVRILATWARLATLGGPQEERAQATDAWLEVAGADPEARARATRLAYEARDPSRLRAVLEAGAASASSQAERARWSVRRARLEADADHGRLAGDLVLAALGDDPELPEAHAWVLVRPIDLPAARRVVLANDTRRALGDSPMVLKFGLDAAREANDLEAMRTFLDARLRLGDSPADAARERLEVALTSTDHQDVRVAADQALSGDACEDDMAELVERAVTLLSDHEPGDAAMLAIRAADRLGDSRFVTLAHRFASDTDLLEPRIAAAERMVAWASGPARAVALRELADLHRQVADPARESRTWLRLLSDEPGDPFALERLTEIYAVTGETERLVAVLGVRAEGMNDTGRLGVALTQALAWLKAKETSRALAALDDYVRGAADTQTAVHAAARALVAWEEPTHAIELLLRVASDAPPGPGERLYEHAVHIAEHDLEDEARLLDLAIEGLERFPTSSKLLVAFERTALARKEVERANATFEKLIEGAIGSHGRRGIAYRHARWLERAGQASPALDAYVRAFKLSPAEGIAFSAIERLAAELGRFDALVAAMLALVERTSHVEKRLALMRNTVALCEGPIGDVNRAFDLMHEAWTSTGRTDLLPDLRRLSRRLTETGSERGEKCFHEMVAHLDERIGSSWDADDQIRCLRIVASIHALELAALEPALEAVDRGMVIARENEDIDRVEAAELACDGAEYALAARSFDEAARRAADALSLVADHARAADLAARAASMGGKRASAPRPLPVPKPPEPAPAAAPAPARAPVAEQAPFGAAPAAASTWTSAPDSRVAAGADPLDALRAAATRTPSDLEAWRAIVAAADAAGKRGLAGLAADVLATLTGGASTHPVPERAAVLSVLGPRSMNIVHDPALASVEALLACLWEGAQPLFRKPLAQFGVVGTQRVTTLTQRPLAVHYGDAVQVLGLDGIALFARPDAESLVEILATSPPSVVVHEAIESDLVALPYRIGRALSLATPSGVLVSSQDLERLEIAIHSLHAAFGPPDSIGTVGREAAALAAELWHTIPARLQSRMRDLLSGISSSFDLDQAIACVDAMSARAGLLVAGLPSQALMSAHADVGGAGAMSLADFMEQTVAGQSIVRASLGTELVDAWNVALR